MDIENFKRKYGMCTKPGHLLKGYCNCIENQIVHDVMMEQRDENGDRLATDEYYNRRLHEEFEILKEERKMAGMTIEQIKELLKNRESGVHKNE